MKCKRKYCFTKQNATTPDATAAYISLFNITSSWTLFDKVIACKNLYPIYFSAACKTDKRFSAGRTEQHPIQ